MGAYLSFSRGAIACLLAGLAAVVAFDRTRAQLRAVAVVLAAAVLASAAAAPFAAVRALKPAHATAEGLAVFALLAAVAAAAFAVQRRAGAGGGGGPVLRAAPVAAAVVVLAVVPYAAVVLGERASPSRDAAFGATNARLSDAGSHRLAYWRVALAVAGDHPLAGAGPGSFGVDPLPRPPGARRAPHAPPPQPETPAG